MKEWRIILDGPPERERRRFMTAFLGRFINELSRQFPSASGYLYEGGWRVDGEGLVWFGDTPSWSISRGRFCGLAISVLPEDKTWKSLRVTIDAYFTVFKGAAEKVESLGGLLRKIPVLGGHLAMLLIFPVLVLLPFIALYQLAKLWLHPKVLAAGRALETAWAERQGPWSREISMSPLLPLSVVYLLVLVLGGGATAGCFWLAGLGFTRESWKMPIYVAGSIFGLFSFVILIALIMTLLGFRVQPRPGSRTSQLIMRFRQLTGQSIESRL